MPEIATRTLVDQVCIDIAPDDYERECAFWAALTGWDRRSALLSEYSPTWSAPNPCRCACSSNDSTSRRRPRRAPISTWRAYDRDAAADWHRELGAVRRERHEYWTTMTDPSGLPYCLTRRNPDTGLLDSPA